MTKSNHEKYIENLKNNDVNRTTKKPAYTGKYRNVFPFKTDIEFSRYISSPLQTNRGLTEYDRTIEAANYNEIGFANGQELRSNDLNELQEKNVENLSLLAETVHQWGYYTGQGDEGGLPQYSQSLGAAGMRPTRIQENKSIRYGGPFWEGATPVAPHGKENNSVTNFKESGIETYKPIIVQNNTLGGGSRSFQNSLKIQFNSGYYFTTIKKDSDDDLEGFRRFLYLDTRKNQSDYETIVSKEQTGHTYVGLVVKSREIYPKTTRYFDENFSDERLTTNDHGTPRIQYYFDGITHSNYTDIPTDDIGLVTKNYDPRGCANTTRTFSECLRCVENSPLPEEINAECDTQLQKHHCWKKHNSTAKLEDSPYCSGVRTACASETPILLDAYAPNCRVGSGLYDTRQAFSPVLYIDHLNKEVRYMNNVLIGTYN